VIVRRQSKSGAFLLERRYQARWKKHEQVNATLTTKMDEDLERRLLKGRELNAKRVEGMSEPDGLLEAVFRLCPLIA